MDKFYLERAQLIAQRSPEKIGCGTVIVSYGEIVAEAFNSQRADEIAVNHAEIKAITLANEELGTRIIPNATAYCSCEPCAMCLTALSYAKIDRIVFDKSMIELFPNDTQAKFDSQAFIKTLNFVPKLEQLSL